MTNISSYINTTSRTIHFTTYINTIWTILKWNILTYHNTSTAIYVVTLNFTIKIYSIIITIYSSSRILIKAYCSSLYSSRLLINTICRICLVFFSNITNSSTIYINTTIRTFNSTFKLYSISTTRYRTLLLKSRCFTLNSSTFLINTICRIYIIFTSNMTNISI